MWGGAFSTFDCALIHLRQREDHWNAIASGFLTGGVLAARAGVKSAGRNAVVGGVLLAIIEGVANLAPRMFQTTPKMEYEKQMQQMEEMKAVEEKQKERGASGVSSWLPSFGSSTASSSSTNEQQLATAPAIEISEPAMGMTSEISTGGQVDTSGFSNPSFSDTFSSNGSSSSENKNGKNGDTKNNSWW